MRTKCNDRVFPLQASITQTTVCDIGSFFVGEVWKFIAQEDNTQTLYVWKALEYNSSLIQDNVRGTMMHDLIFYNTVNRIQSIFGHSPLKNSRKGGAL